MGEKETRTPEGVLAETTTISDFTQHKDTNYPLDMQVVPCVGCAKWNYCGRLEWLDCHRFGLFLKLRKEAKRNGQTV